MERNGRWLAVMVGALLLTSWRFGETVRAGEPARVDGVETEGHGLLIVAGWGGPYSMKGGCPRDWDRTLLCPEDVGDDFVLYDDGRVIYRGGEPDRTRMLTANIGPRAAADLVRELVAAGFKRLPRYDDLSEDRSHQSGASIFLRDGQDWYGVHVSGIERYGETSRRHLLPFHAFAFALRRLELFEAPNARPWRPDAVSMHFRNTRYYLPEGKLNAVTWPFAAPRLPPSGRDEYLEDVYTAAEYTQLASEHPELFEHRAAIAVHGREWLLGTTPVIAEHAYLDKVAARLSWMRECPGGHGE